MDNLEKCPFCGGEAAHVTNYRMHTGCFDCDISNGYVHAAIQCLSCGGVMMGTAERWNRRYVCDAVDESGKSVKVFAGDRVKVNRGIGEICYSVAPMAYCVILENEGIQWIFEMEDGDEITLIESKG